MTKDHRTSGKRIRRSAGPSTIIALHCSGGDDRQWRGLRGVLGDRHQLETPLHYGSGKTGNWTGQHAFTLADEAVRALELIDQNPEKVHLIGHSYGGAVALHIAMARPDRIASLAVYEPVMFSLLTKMGSAGDQGLLEIEGLIGRVRHGVISGDYRSAMAAFVDYWSGPGTWQNLHQPAQDALSAWAPKALLDFHALMNEDMSATAFGRLDFPVLILRGDFAPAPTRLIGDALHQRIPNSRLVVIEGAGHMGPLTHAQHVHAEIMGHINTTSRSGRESESLSMAA